MGKYPGSGRLKPNSSSQAAEPEGPEGEAPLPAPEAGPAGAGGVEGSAVQGLSAGTACISVLAGTGSDDIPVTDSKFSAVPGEFAEPSAVLFSAAAVAAAGASVTVEISPATAIPSSGSSPGSVTGEDGTVTSIRSTTGFRTGSRTGAASMSGGATV